jgi:phage terminase large subunit
MAGEAPKKKRIRASDAIAGKSLNRKDGFSATYEPLPHQADFHQNPSKYRAMVSGVGGGKTSMGVRESIKFSQVYPGSLGLIGRLEATSLRDTTMRRFFEICPPELIYHWKETTGHLLLYTPVKGIYSEILFRRLDEPGPLGSLDLDYFWIDEAHEADGGEVPEDTFLMLMARLRGVVGPLRGWVTSNSGGKDWIWRWFFSPKRSSDCYGRVVKSDENPYLPPGYVEGLRRNNPVQWVERFMDASFEVFEGQIFTEFVEKFAGQYAQTLAECYECHVYDQNSKEIREHVKKIKRKEGGMDFGIAAPTAIPLSKVGVAQDGMIDIWIYDEFYKEEAHIKTVCMWTKGHGLNYLYADPSTQNRGASGESPMMLYAKEGVSLIPSPNDVPTKIATIHQFLLKFRLHVSSKCVNVITQLQTYKWKPQPRGSGADYREKPLKRDDHILDALGYLLMSVGLGALLFDPLTPGQPVKQTSNNEYKRHSSLDEDEDNENNDYVTLKDFITMGGV